METIGNDRLRLSVKGRKALHNICVEKYKEEHANSTPSKTNLRLWILEEYHKLGHTNGSLSDSSLKKLLNHIEMEGNLERVIDGRRIRINQPYSSNIDDLARAIGYRGASELRRQINKDLKFELRKVDLPQDSLLKDHYIEIHFTNNEILLLAYEERNRYKIIESNIENLYPNYIVTPDKIKVNETFQVDQLLNEEDDPIENHLSFKQIIEMIKLIPPK
jgi:hypothetical protein